MAKTTTTKRGTARKKAGAKPAAAASRPRARRSSASESSAADAFFKLLESPLVADLLAVGATAALAAITEQRSTRKAVGHSGNVLKAAGAAAAAAIGRRLASEFKEIKAASKKATGA